MSWLWAEKHAWASTSSPVGNHLKTCQNFIDLFSLFSLYSDLFTDDNSVNNDITFREFSIERIRSTPKVIECRDNWNILLFYEALHISRENVGLKASRQMQLFR